MSRQQLLLTKEQVPFGAEMFLCPTGTEPLKRDEKGPVPPLILLGGGVPVRAKWYMSNPEKPDKRDLVGGGYEYDSLEATTYFVPAYPHSQESAPVRKSFAVFVDGKRLMYSYPYHKKAVEVSKTSNGDIISTCGTAYDYWLQPYELPERAILVADGNLDADLDFRFLGCVSVPEPSDEVREALEAKGVVLYYHAYFNHGRYSGYRAAKLPVGWKLVDVGRAWMGGISYKVDIVDRDGVAHAHIKQNSRSLSDSWVGEISLP